MLARQQPRPADHNPTMTDLTWGNIESDNLLGYASPATVANTETLPSEGNYACGWTLDVGNPPSPSNHPTQGGHLSHWNPTPMAGHHKPFNNVLAIDPGAKRLGAESASRKMERLGAYFLTLVTQTLRSHQQILRIRKPAQGIPVERMVAEMAVLESEAPVVWKWLKERVEPRMDLITQELQVNTPDDYDEVDYLDSVYREFWSNLSEGTDPYWFFNAFEHLVDELEEVGLIAISD